MNKLKNYFIPHKGNAYKPHFFRTKAVLLMSALVGVLFLFASALNTLVIQNGGQMLGAVVSSVLVDLTNTDRSENKLQGLTVSPVLEAVAQMKADDMATKGYFAHTSPEGKTPWYWFKQGGYSYSFAGENLAVYFSDSSDLEKAWMNSPTHRANILNSYFTEIGIAMAKGTYLGKDTVYVVQVFGRPIRGMTTTVVKKTDTVSETIISDATTSKIALNTKPVVKGASTEVSPKVIKQEDTFIAVARGEELDVSTSTLVVAKIDIKKPTTMVKVVTSPRSFLKVSYEIISVFMLLALALFVGVEYKRQHIRHIFYGVGVIVFMWALYLSWTYFIFGKVMVL